MTVVVAKRHVWLPDVGSLEAAGFARELTALVTAHSNTFTTLIPEGMTLLVVVQLPSFFFFCAYSSHHSIWFYDGRQIMCASQNQECGRFIGH